MSARQLRFRPEALDEVRSARRWYEAQVRGLGRAFIAELDALSAMLLEHPEMFPVVTDAADVRRALLHRFPYAVFYQIMSPTELVVLRCRHVRQDDVSFP